ncbi:MAG TPA: TonB family protein [Candidatus Baltobacteraceae bacterium]|jgi:TonB family protein|nr:TonB family protein [Candidatus Baltobacteraceae bacterium]
MMTGECARTEVLAGAVALGEASDAERDQYRRHIAACRRCVNAFGGEREIERTASVIARARDAETWEPDLRGWMRAPQKRRMMSWSFGLSGVAAAVVISLGIHAIVAANISRPAQPSDAPTETIALGGMHVTLEHRPPATPTQTHHAAPQALVAPPRLEVEHNVITLRRPAQPVAAQAAPRIAGTPKPTLHRADVLARQRIVAMAPTQRDERSISALKTAATAAPAAAHAESMAIVPTVTTIHDAMPAGGENAIVPHPSPIAYNEGAEGTTAFEVSIDEKGAPVKCTITKPSGYLVLDDAVCKAAMHVHYSPKTINGHAVSGVYRDAFTFRASDEQQ